MLAGGGGGGTPGPCGQVALVTRRQLGADVSVVLVNHVGAPGVTACLPENAD